jgi:hypothetical protein
MDALPTVFSHCQVCRLKLEHTALFCPKCGISTCSWECYVQHLAEHTPGPSGKRRHGPSRSRATKPPS